MSQGKLFARPRQQRPTEVFKTYDEANLRCARIILTDRAKYDKPDSGFLILWAKAVIKRLGTEEERNACM